MRSHGVPGYPDPQVSSSAGQIHVRLSPGSTNPNSPAFHAADQACHQLLPGGGAPGAESAQQHAQGVMFADCMRSHGVPSFPDPDRGGAFDLPSEVNPKAPQFGRAVQACKQLRPNSFLINQGLE
jgi:hypothetical protein